MRQTPLHLAVQDGSSDMVQLLLSHGADVTSKDLSQKTTLHCAIVSSTVEVYKLLSGSKRSNKIYQEEAKPYIKSNNEWGTLQVSLLHVAAENGWDNLCQELIQHHNYGIDWEVCFYKRPIHFALENGHLNLAKRAVKEWGACLAPEIQLLRAIFDCERGPKAGRIDLNPLDRDRLEAVFLEECLRTYANNWGCNINAVDEQGCTIFYESLSWFDMRAIMNVGLPITFNHLNDQHQTLLHCGSYWLSIHGLKMFLSQSQFDVNTRDREGRTPLHCVSRGGSKRCSHVERSREVQLLLDFGADRTLLDNEGRSATDLVLQARDHEAGGVLDVLVNYATAAINVQEVELILEDKIWP
jgi:ankyrin repeat protein